MLGFIKKLFGTKNERELKKMLPIVDRINNLEPQFKKLSNDELRGKTAEFRQRLDNGESLDALLPESFATVREASVRALGMRHYDVQMLGGLVLHSGKIAEMRTGEGKTIVATLPVYTNALLRRGVHVVTVNDYLATRDAEWMGQIYKFLGMTIGTVVHGQSSRQKQESYGSDIAYGTNNEFGFDYLRDNMQFYLADYVQRELYYAIVDEVDSILIDEARTPLIISGRSEDSSELYRKIDPLIYKLKKVDIPNMDAYRKFETDGKTPPPGDYVVDEKAHSAILTEDGTERMEKLLSGINVLKGDNLYDPANIEVNHHVQQALKAHTLYKRDVNYIIEDGKVVIVDEHTGRKMAGRRWSDGLHQAVEAKEGVRVEEENRTLATVTFQNFFRMYKKLGGMTGTADTEAEEFGKIYNLDVMIVPTNRPMIRKDAEDVVYKTFKEKTTAVVEEILDCHKRGQPVLVGTVSVEKNEMLSEILQRKGVPHNVLNAKQHAREAEIVAQAGRKGSITIATNMAGRGTDILLGGNAEFMAKAVAGHPPLRTIENSDEDYEKILADHGKKIEETIAKMKEECAKERQEVLELGGLHIIGTERHESRRIDNQLRGRAGRQGDPGSSRFYLSLEDDLMRIFAADRIMWVMDKLGIEEGVPIEHKWVTKSIINAQKKVEAHHFDARKHLLDYDDVMNQQRKTIYRLRRNVLEGKLTHIGADGEVEDVEKKDSKTPDIDNLPKDKIYPKDYKNPLAAMMGEQPTEEAKSGAMKIVYEGTWEQMLDILEETVLSLIAQHCQAQHAEEWDVDGLREKTKELLNIDIDFSNIEYDRDVFAEKMYAEAEKYIKRRGEEAGEERFRGICRWLYLKQIDDQWMEHLSGMDHLREGIGLRGYSQKDPKVEYKKEGFAMFSEMINLTKEQTIKTVMHIKFQDEVKPEDFAPKRPALPTPPQAARSASPVQLQARPSAIQLQPGNGNGQQPSAAPQAAAPAQDNKPGRNDPCYCGSGKKYKKCHLESDEKGARA
jgi:preprotein translocase subunit SecA